MNQDIEDARTLANALNREYRRKTRDEAVIDQIIKDIRGLLRDDGMLYKARYGWRLKLWSGSDRDKGVDKATPEQPRRGSNRPRRRGVLKATKRGYRHIHTNKKPSERLSRPRRWRAL